MEKQNGIELVRGTELVRVTTSRTAVPCCALFFGVMNYSWQICSRFGLLQPFPDLRRIVLNTLMSLYLLLRVGFILSYVL